LAETDRLPMCRYRLEPGQQAVLGVAVFAHTQHRRGGATRLCYRLLETRVVSVPVTWRAQVTKGKLESKKDLQGGGRG
jgi:hypothetical protein